MSERTSERTTLWTRVVRKNGAPVWLQVDGFHKGRRSWSVAGHRAEDHGVGAVVMIRETTSVKLTEAEPSR